MNKPTNISYGWCTTCYGNAPGDAGYCQEPGKKKPPKSHTDERGVPKYGQRWGYCESFCNTELEASRLMEVKLDTLTNEEE